MARAAEMGMSCMGLDATRVYVEMSTFIFVPVSTIVGGDLPRPDVYVSGLRLCEWHKRVYVSLCAESIRYDPAA